MDDEQVYQDVKGILDAVQVPLFMIVSLMNNEI